MSKSRLAALVGICLLAACSPQAETPAATETEQAAQGSSGVHMDAATQSRMGVRVTAIEVTNAPQTVQGFARVMDVGPLAALDAEVGAARAAAAASQAEYRRLAALAAADQAASVRAVEAARAQAEADSARVALASRRIGLEWGAGIARLSAAQRARLLSDIAMGRAALIRVDAPETEQGATRVLLDTNEAAAPTVAASLGPAAGADPRLQTAGILAIVRGEAAGVLRPGRLIRAEVEIGAALPGVLLPRGALIRSGESLWAYVRTADDAFERREVVGAHAIEQGWFAPSGFAAGEIVVSEGAASLMAAERGPVEAE
jgi:hypothetical protein